jgi:hypothetical protein
MARLIFLIVVDLVLLIDAFVRFGIADPIQLRLRGDVLLQIPARTPALAWLDLGEVELYHIAVVILARGFGAAVLQCHSPSLRRTGVEARRSRGLAQLGTAASSAGWKSVPAGNVQEISCQLDRMAFSPSRLPRQTTKRLKGRVIKVFCHCED